MKEKLTRNIGLKILSIILAALLWLVITNVDDPITQKPFYNVPVEILNKSVLTDLNQVYEITEGATIDFTVAARRNITDDLTVSDFKVTADFSKLSDVNAVTIDIKCPRYGDEVTVAKGLYQVMKVDLEELTQKNFKVNVVQIGEPADGYYVAEKTASTIINVSGPKTKMERIAEIVAEVDVTGVAGSFRTNEKPKALDESGKEIDASNLKFNFDYVTINIGMLKTKPIDLLVTVTGKPADGYIMAAYDYEPKSIKIAGEAAALNNIQSLTVEENIDGASENIKKEINLQNQLPEGIILTGDNQTVTVEITLVRAETKEITVLPEEIEIRNKPEDLDYIFISGSVILRLYGPVTETAGITVKTLKPYVDLSGCSAGTYGLSVRVNATGLVTLENSPTLSLYLKQKQ
jgi:YbbR domain-containing protein